MENVSTKIGKLCIIRYLNNQNENIINLKMQNLMFDLDNVLNFYHFVHLIQTSIEAKDFIITFIFLFFFLSDYF